MDTVERVEHIAMIQFAEKGYDRVSLNDILKKAEVSKGSFYHHFTNKEELYASLVGKVVEEKWKRIHELGLDQSIPNGLFSLLRIQIRAAIQFIQEKPEYQKFSESVMKEKNTELRDRIFLRFKLDYKDSLLHLVRHAVEVGEVRSDISPEQVNSIMMLLLQNMTELMDVKGDTTIWEYENVADTLIDVLENGLGKN